MSSNFYTFDEVTMKYYLKTEFRACNVNLYYTCRTFSNSATELWDKTEEKILRPDKEGCFLSLQTDSFVKHTTIMCFYFGLIENDIYSNVINHYSHVFETFDVYSQQYGFVFNYLPNTLTATVTFSRKFSKNIVASFLTVSGASNIKSSRITIGMSGDKVFDNHVSVRSIDISQLSNFLYQYIILDDWGIKLRIENKPMESTDSGAKGEFRLIKDTPYLHMNIFSKNIIRSVLIQRSNAKLKIFNLVHKLMHKSTSQLFVTNDGDCINSESNSSVIYVDIFNKIRCYNINKKKVEDFQFILLTASTEINEQLRITLYNSGSEKNVQPIGVYHLYDKTCVWMFRLENSRAFSWYKVTDETETKKDNFYEVKKFVNDYRNPICLL